MKIQFEKNQQYQLDAIKAVIDILEGQDLNKTDFEFTIADEDRGSLQLTEKGVGNRLTVASEQILTNIKAVQELNEIEPSQQLEYLSFKGDGKDTVSTNFGNFSVEMETGTGKTYVYLRTIYELNKVYGFKKFVIVVPSVAIREGVIKNLQITFDHFQELYESIPASFEVYDSKKLVSLSNFARSNTIQILVINIDSFSKDSTDDKKGNIINQVRERGIKPIEHIQGTSPIVIVDEPQNMETDIRKKAIANLNPLFTLRYSATHTNSYNLIYKLDPVKAYDLGLVKQIEVHSVITENDNGGAFLSLDGFKLAKQSVSATLTILKQEKSGVGKKQVTAKTGDNLYQLSGGVEAYKNGYIINSIDSEEECIELANGAVIYKGEPQGGMNEDVQKEMIRATIENHLQKEKELNKKGIKVLSVFFLDKVSNYRTYKADGGHQLGQFAIWFEEILEQSLKNPKYKELYSYKVSDMHDGYFSQDKGKFKDSTEGRSTKADDEAFQLIMKDKERLLDMNTPLRFIFSHSALREGWDNPNVFQICTLNETKSEIKKRQEIGRGLRLCVNQEGARNTDRSINKLTVIANESYDSFAKSLQEEIEKDCGVKFEGRIKNARNRQKIELKKNWQFDEYFMDLWSRIKHKTEYKVNYDTQELIKNASEAVKQMPFTAKPKIQHVKTGVVFEKNKEGKLSEIGGEVKSSKERVIEGTRFEIPDFVGYIQSKTELTRKTVSQIILESGRLSEIFNNPQVFMDSVVKAIKSEFDKLKVNGIKYERIAGQSYEMTLFESGEIESYLENMIAVKKQEKTLYNYVLIDSLSSPEQKFAQECETRDDVLFYIKLPSWFVVKTPIGNYNPDWALIKQEEGEQKKVYFVAETKDPKAAQDKTLLRESERMKIRCGEKHFAEFSNEEVQYKVVGNLMDL
ncbi:DEAD/DEAH box helicase family protein [Flectobacillus sp. DC10W]|uniref:DEAD/DEAH box helicase family protein n=1 Tax=Flectobacillus longus TaxID=2984207 RepID=A0ABT6YVS4_9BACT|nr:DEAD/DEAH box helicase family protein [Flectobacillus longus]MDI9867552.1 DEAD/DEAH box helicase family protein [Flectobacillus longus]